MAKGSVLSTWEVSVKGSFIRCSAVRSLGQATLTKGVPLLHSGLSSTSMSKAAKRCSRLGTAVPSWGTGMRYWPSGSQTRPWLVQVATLTS